MAVERCSRGRMARQTFGSLVAECKRSAWQDSEDTGTKWKRFQKKKKGLIKCVASSEAYMCQAFASANNLTKQILGYRPLNIEGPYL